MSQKIYLVIRYTRGRPLYTTDRSLALRLVGLPTDTELLRDDLDGLLSAQSEDDNSHVVEWENKESDYDGKSSIWMAEDSDGAILDVSRSASVIMTRIDPDSQERCDRFSLLRGATEQDI